MNAFLTSSPFVNDADRAILSNANGFVEKIREALPENPRCLYVSSSPDRHDLNCRFAADIFTAFAEAGTFFGSFQILDDWTANNAPELVKASDFLVLAGGHVPTQNAFFQRVGLRDLLADFTGTVMGISAGTMNAADWAYIQPEEPGESSPDFPRWARGLGLTDVNILPHYQKVKDDILDGLRLFEDITYADSMGNEFFALPDGSFLLADGQSQTIFGESYRIRDGILEKLTEEGETLDLSRLR